MADKDQLQSDEENVKHNAETDVTELDDQALDQASGGAVSEDELESTTNNNCLC